MNLKEKPSFETFMINVVGGIFMLFVLLCLLAILAKHMFPQYITVPWEVIVTVAYGVMAVAVIVSIWLALRQK